MYVYIISNDSRNGWAPICAKPFLRAMLPVNMPELGRFWAVAASIGPEPAQFWHITACLQESALFKVISP